MSGGKWDDLVFLLILLMAAGSIFFLVVVGVGGYWLGYSLTIYIHSLLTGLLPM